MKQLKLKFTSSIKKSFFRFINYILRKLFTHDEIIELTNDLIDIYNSKRSFTWVPWNVDFYNKMFVLLKDAIIEGDYLEFGVANGTSFIFAYQAAQKFNLKSMRFYAFDSFQGLPEIRNIDAEVKNFKEGMFNVAESEFLKRLKKDNVDLSKVQTIHGWFNETLTNETKMNLLIKKASVIMVDCDLYESTVPVLDFIVDYLQDGTIIVFDDWFCFRGNPNRGEQRAFREWLKRNPSIKVSEFHKYGAEGNSFIVHIDD